MNKITEIAKMIDHSILHPTLTDDDLKRECEVAKKYNVASVCVKPYAVKLAVEILKGSEVAVGTVIGFPAGNSSIAVKVFETETACSDGAIEIDMVINIGKALQEDWKYLEEEIKAVVDTSHRFGAITKVIFETDFITRDEQKIRLCEICSKAGAEYVKTSTGFGFVKGSDGKYSYTGATAHDLALMRKYSAPEVKVKAAGGVRTLADLLKYKELGISRCGATATAAMLEEAKKLFGE
jgi:deoxyribose-phosphate aldolase